MAPRAHDEHVGATIGDSREEYVADGDIVGGCIRGCRVDAMTAEMRRDVGAKCMLPFVRARAEHSYRFRFLQEWQRIMGGTCRLAASEIGRASCRESVCLYV